MIHRTSTAAVIACRNKVKSDVLIPPELPVLSWGSRHPGPTELGLTVPASLFLYLFGDLLKVVDNVIADFSVLSRRTLVPHNNNTNNTDSNDDE